MAGFKKEILENYLQLIIPVRFLNSGLYLFLILIGYGNSETESKNISQCFNYEANFSNFVSLYCGYNQVIHIKEALHGVHKLADINYCSRLDNDCIIDTTMKYDWSNCEGKNSCVKSLELMDMGQCGDNTKKTQYLQVVYNCRESPTQKMTFKTLKVTKPTPKPVSMKKICTNFTSQESSVILVSPSFPDHYTSGSDCRCVIQAEETSKIAVTFYEIDLQMKNSLCEDWLLLQSPNYKDSTVVACGILQNEMRTLESKSNWLLLHFHTSRVLATSKGKNSAGIVERSGFKIEIQSSEQKLFKLKCYTVDPSFINTLSYKNGKEDEASNLVLPASDWDKVSKPGPLSSNVGDQCRLNKQLLAAIITISSWIYLIHCGNL